EHLRRVKICFVRRIHVDIDSEVAAQTRETGRWIWVNHRCGHYTTLARKPVAESDQIIETTLRESKLSLMARTYHHGTIGESLEQKLRNIRTNQIARRKSAKQGGARDPALSVARPRERSESG